VNNQTPANIKNIIKADLKWFIQDANGYMYSLKPGSEDYQVVYNFNEGEIKDVATSPSHNYVISLGQNGSI
jgi:hypothetical protein